MTAVAQSLIVSGTAGLTFTNDPTSTDYVIPEGGLSWPDFDMRNEYLPDVDNVPGSLSRAFALGLGSMPLLINTHGTSLADLQVNRRALEACFSQEGETITLNVGGETEEYPFIPTWPKWGVIDSGRLERRIFTATLAVPVNPLVVA